MFPLALTLFVAGLLTIFLPCILPLVPIVLGVSLAEKHPWRPFVTVVGMIVSFVGSTFLLQVLLRHFITLANIVQTGTFYVLLLFGIGFLLHSRALRLIGTSLGSLFFYERSGVVGVLVALVIGIIAMEIGGRIATKIQQAGTDIQTSTRQRFGSSSLLSAFIIGLTMGLVWVPCAGPALGYALTLVRNQPGLHAFLLLSAYGVGAGIPLLLIGYGGQAALRSVHSLNRYTDTVKRGAGMLLILSALGFRFNFFQDLQTLLVQNTTFGTLGTSIEESLFSKPSYDTSSSFRSDAAPSQTSPLPVLSLAPQEFVGLGQWHNSPPLSLSALRGKVVLIDFWTYSCINCIRTLPYMEGYWQKYKDKPFVLIGVHTPEFIFEKDDANLARAIKEHGLTYPVVQDNDYKTWNAFRNHYWPAKYLIDAQGRIRYTHFGEGEYAETDAAIADLLGDIGVVNDAPSSSSPSSETSAGRSITPETYLHSRSWNAFANAQGDPDAFLHTYTSPHDLPLHRFALEGSWQLADDERQVLRSATGSLSLHALAGEINLVLGLEKESTSPVSVDVVVDGAKTTTLTIDHHDLYRLFQGTYGEHSVVLHFHGSGLGAYAFTFGA